MLREAARKSPDMDVLEQTEPQALDPDSIHRYRSRMILRHPEHIWQELETPDFLYKLGALGKGRDGKLHPTAAGLLMFGYEYEIVREFPSYFLDYQDMTVSESGQKKYHQVRRIVSSSGDWSGNLFDFYFRVCRALAPACAVQSLSSAMDLSDISGEDPDLESAEKKLCPGGSPGSPHQLPDQCRLLRNRRNRNPEGTGLPYLFQSRKLPHSSGGRQKRRHLRPQKYHALPDVPSDRYRGTYRKRSFKHLPHLEKAGLARSRHHAAYRSRQDHPLPGCKSASVFCRRLSGYPEGCPD